jgi:hypothetical protein
MADNRRNLATSGAGAVRRPLSTLDYARNIVAHKALLDDIKNQALNRSEVSLLSVDCESRKIVLGPSDYMLLKKDKQRASKP